MNTSVIVPSSALKVNRARSPERVLTPQRSRGVRELDLYHQVQLRRQHLPAAQDARHGGAQQHVHVAALVPIRPSLRAEAEAGHQDPRAAGGARGAVEVVRGAGAGVPGPAPGRLGARDLPEAAQGEAGSARRGGEAEDPGRAGRQVRACAAAG